VKFFELWRIGYSATQRARKIEKVQAKTIVKSNKSKFFLREIAFLAIFVIAKNGIWSNDFFVKLIHLISRVFLA